jgi:hypothetical protein
LAELIGSISFPLPANFSQTFCRVSFALIGLGSVMHMVKRISRLYLNERRITIAFVTLNLEIPFVLLVRVLLVIMAMDVIFTPPFVPLVKCHI